MRPGPAHEAAQSTALRKSVFLRKKTSNIECGRASGPASREEGIAANRLRPSGFAGQEKRKRHKEEATTKHAKIAKRKVLSARFANFACFVVENGPSRYAQFG